MKASVSKPDEIIRVNVIEKNNHSQETSRQFSADIPILDKFYQLEKEKKLNSAGNICEFYFSPRDKNHIADLQSDVISKLLEWLQSHDCHGYSVSATVPDMNEKFLFQFDADMTFYQHEIIDELGKAAGCESDVVKITAMAMEGEYDFKKSLEKRIALLSGMTAEAVFCVGNDLNFTFGIEKIMRFIQQNRYHSGIVSGGFDQIIGFIREKHSLDYLVANELEIENKRLSGRLVGRVIDSIAKKEILEKMKNEYRIKAENTVAIGDGYNDLEVLREAGSGIAYRAKPVLRQEAKAVINAEDISLGLYLLGFEESHIEKTLK